MKKVNLANNLNQRVRVFTLAGVRSAELDGDVVTGRWQDDLTKMFGSKRTKSLIAEFANWPSTAAKILNFTKRYGALSCAASSGTSNGGETFSEPLSAWRESQRIFQRRWEQRNILVYAPTALGTAEASHNMIHLSHRGGAVIQVGTLYWLLTVELFLLPQERTKKCQRPGCENPYFIAHHLKQRYCGEECARWAQQQWKLEWWAREGQKWRVARASSKSKNKREQKTRHGKAKKARKARTK
jgi:hypothetical protein